MSFHHRYDIIDKKYNFGSSSVIMLCFDHVTNQQVIIKKIRKCNARFNSGLVENEINVNDQLKDVGIPKLIEFFENGCDYCLVFELAKGLELYSTMKNTGFKPLTEEYCKKVFIKICELVEKFKDFGISHRDIKLEHIFIQDDPFQVTMIDFGLSSFSKEGCLTKNFYGSENYIAPEIVQEKSHDAFKSDIFSLGVVLYSMATGTFPFHSLINTYIQHGSFASIKLTFPDNVKISRDLKNLLIQMLQFDPSKRPNIQDLKQSKWFHM